MTPMIFNPVGQELKWVNVNENFCINLQLAFDDYQEEAKTDLDQLAVFVLEENIFHDPSFIDEDQVLEMSQISAMAIRRMYFHTRLKCVKYDGFIYQFEEMIRNIESFFQDDLKGAIELTTINPTSLS